MTTRMALRLTEPGKSQRGTCDRLNKRSSETVGRAEVHGCKNRNAEIHAKSECFTAVRPKSGFLQHFYVRSQPIGSTVTASRKSQPKADGKVKSQQHGRSQLYESPDNRSECQEPDRSKGVGSSL